MVSGVFLGFVSGQNEAGPLVQVPYIVSGLDLGPALVSSAVCTVSGTQVTVAPDTTTGAKVIVGFVGNDRGRPVILSNY